MSKYFRPWNIDQTLLLPPHVQDFVPKGHVSRFIVELVRESLDLKEITGSYVSGLGQPPFEPRMMVALLTRQAPDSRERKNWRTADPTDAKEDRRWRLRNALPIEKASGGTGVRTDQTGARLPPVPVAERRESACRVGHDLHHPQPPQAVQPRKRRVRPLLCNK